MGSGFVIVMSKNNTRPRNINDRRHAPASSCYADNHREYKAHVETILRCEVARSMRALRPRERSSCRSEDPDFGQEYLRETIAAKASALDCVANPAEDCQEKKRSQMRVRDE